MSRTDKTRPIWIRALDETESREEIHSYECQMLRIACDLGLPPVQKRRRQYVPHCEYYPIALPWYYRYGSPHWHVNETWNAPERTRERNQLSEARKLANAGELDDDFDFPNFQHHHGASWLYW